MFLQEQVQSKESTSKASKHPARLRNKEFLIRFTQEEFDELNYFIKKSGKNRAEFILDLIGADKIVIIEDLTKTWVELQKQGNNINQIAKSVNMRYGRNEDIEYIKVFIDDVESILIKTIYDVVDNPRIDWLRNDLGFKGYSELIFDREQELRNMIKE